MTAINHVPQVPPGRSAKTDHEPPRNPHAPQRTHYAATIAPETESGR